MNGWLAVASVCGGLGLFLLVRELVPAPPRLDAALDRLSGGGPPPATGVSRRLARQVTANAPWLPVPAADLRLLGQDPEGWLATKVMLGLLGLAIPTVASVLLAAGGVTPGWAPLVVSALVMGAVLFLLPDLVTRTNAAEKRADFRYALASYLDLVGLQRSAGAGGTDALEAAAGIGRSWAFARIKTALRQARQAGREPWAGLAALAEETGVPELADLAGIAGAAGQEGAKVLDTLVSRAAAMRAEAMAKDRARAGSRSTTMVIPVALLGAGFVLLLIFPDFYRVFVA